jgi:hypothetical protein
MLALFAVKPNSVRHCEELRSSREAIQKKFGAQNWIASQSIGPPLRGPDRLARNDQTTSRDYY